MGPVRALPAAGGTGRAAGSHVAGPQRGPAEHAHGHQVRVGRAGHRTAVDTPRLRPYGRVASRDRAADAPRTSSTSVSAGPHVMAAPVGRADAGRRDHTPPYWPGHARLRPEPRSTSLACMHACDCTAPTSAHAGAEVLLPSRRSIFMDQAVRRRRRALFLLFLPVGIAMSSWVTHTPAISASGRRPARCGSEEECMSAPDRAAVPRRHVGPAGCDGEAVVHAPNSQHDRTNATGDCEEDWVLPGVAVKPLRTECRADRACREVGRLTVGRERRLRFVSGLASEILLFDQYVYPTAVTPLKVAAQPVADQPPFVESAAARRNRYCANP